MLLRNLGCGSRDLLGERELFVGFQIERRRVSEIKTNKSEKRTKGSRHVSPPPPTLYVDRALSTRRL